MRFGGLIERTDRTLLLVTLVIWESLAVYAGILVANSGVAGGGVAFVVYVLALLIWGKLLKDWLDERRNLINRVAGEGATVGEEMRRLREAIERLRESLES